MGNAQLPDIRSLNVVYRGRVVGTLAQTVEGPLAFSYDSSWLAHGFSISPLSLPLVNRVFVAKLHPLGGVFGVFDDSLPDGWGRLLVDRMLRKRGIDPYEVSPLVRLAIVGESGMGALEYVPSVDIVEQIEAGDLDDIADECARVLRTNHSENLDELFALGGSSGGARPKILTNIDGEDWIVKFPSSHDPSNIGASEYGLMLAARECGIETPQVRLLPSRQCDGYFAVRRFDRARDQHGNPIKVHMASVGALLETSHRIPNLDYDLLMRLTMKLTGDMAEVERMYRLMAFNVFVGNKDDHSKNFTFLQFESEGESLWTLSPAYDLTRNAGVNGEHATTVNGKGRGIALDDVVAVGVRSGIPKRKAREIASQIEEIARGIVAS